MQGTIIITIDGPAGAGKSTVAQKLASRLGYAYLDTGAMYRALTLKALREKLNLGDEKQLVELAKRTSIDLQGEGNKDFKILLDNKDVSREIRSLEVTNNTFYIARAPGVRAIMVEWQRILGTQRNVIAEGRDIGTVVFPTANFKFYLDADFEERSKRRIQELKEKGQNVDEQALKGDLKDRDHKDLTRTTGPLKKADDAIFIDSTHLSIDEVVDKILKYIQSKEKITV